MECDLCHSTNNKELQQVTKELFKTSKFYQTFSFFAVAMITIMILTSAYNIGYYIVNRNDYSKMQAWLMKVNMLVFMYMLGYFVTSGLLSIVNYAETRKSVKDLDDIAYVDCFKNSQINVALQNLSTKALKVSWVMTQDSGIIICLSILSTVGVIIAEHILLNTKRKHEPEQSVL